MLFHFFKSVTVEENENINQELNTQSSSSPVLKKEKNSSINKKIYLNKYLNCNQALNLAKI